MHHDQEAKEAAFGASKPCTAGSSYYCPAEPASSPKGLVSRFLKIRDILEYFENPCDFSSLCAEGAEKITLFDPESRYTVA